MLAECVARNWRNSVWRISSCLVVAARSVVRSAGAGGEGAVGGAAGAVAAAGVLAGVGAVALVAAALAALSCLLFWLVSLNFGQRL